MLICFFLSEDCYFKGNSASPLCRSYNKELETSVSFVQDMLKSKSYLDRDYGSALTISLNDPCYEIYYGEEQPLSKIPTASSDQEKEDEVSGRNVTGLLFAIVSFTCVGMALVIFCAIIATHPRTSQVA